jgi:hypothetical protein
MVLAPIVVNLVSDPLYINLLRGRIQSEIVNVRLKFGDR